MLGQAAVAMWWDISPEARPEWEDWHTNEHMPERLGIPGFLRGSRWVALSGELSYFVWYEAKDLATITAGPYLHRLNNPSPWSQKMMPHHRNMVRSLCRVRVGFGEGLGQAMATIRFSAAGADALPELRPRRGVTGMRLLEAQPTPGAPTAEQKIRGGVDARADWALLVCGYDVDAVGAAAAEYRLPSAVAGLYHLSYSLTPKDLA